VVRTIYAAVSGHREKIPQVKAEGATGEAGKPAKNRPFTTEGTAAIRARHLLIKKETEKERRPLNLFNGKRSIDHA
jgi:hypothetical protein